MLLIHLIHFSLLVGFGRLGENSIYPIILQQVETPVVANNECKKLYENNGSVSKTNEYRLDEEYVLCAGLTAGGKGSCEGDSGGPMMLPIFENGRFPYYQIGIVSNGVGCGRPNLPSIYTNVQKYVDWINSNLH